VATKFAPPSPPFISARHRGGRQTPKGIVLHGTVSSDNRGTARNIANWWHGPTSPVTSAHYVVDPGEVIQTVGDHSVAYHCGYNTGTIAVEFCDEQKGPASRWSDADSVAILKRGARLVAELCLAYGIEAKRPSISDLKRRGPHGIYGHNDSRLAFGRTTHTDPRDFPWALFLTMVNNEIRAIRSGAVKQAATKPAPKVPGRPAKGYVRVKTAHISLQVQDTEAQRIHDINKVFAREAKVKAAWITGTEAWPKDSPSFRAIEAACKKYGYRLWFHPSQDSWVAVREDLIHSGWDTYYKKVLNGKAGQYTQKGVLAVSFFNRQLGHVTVMACHMQTKGRKKGDLRYSQNVLLNDAIRKFAKEKGAGAWLIFYGGDQNIVDRVQDTFMGGPFRSVWDRLKKYPSTGHDNIDVIASSPGDVRVKPVWANAFGDKSFSLYGDHYLVEAWFDIRTL